MTNNALYLEAALFLTIPLAALILLNWKIIFSKSGKKKIKYYLLCEYHAILVLKPGDMAVIDADKCTVCKGIKVNDH